MDITLSDILLAVFFWLLNSIIIIRLAWKKNATFLILWPLVIYSIGPITCLTFLDNDVLIRYIRPELIFQEDILFLAVALSVITIDHFFDLNRSITKALTDGIGNKLGDKKIVGFFFVLSSLAACALQGYALLHYGGIITGQYLQNEIGDEDLPLWGMIAGVYDLVLTGFILLTFRTKSKIPLIYILLYVFSLLLRVLGGTRLIIIKEAVLIVFLLLVNKKVKPIVLAYVAVPLVILGSIIGTLRAGGENELSRAFGPLYSVMAEAGLNALTLNIAFDLYDSGSDVQAKPSNSVEYLAVSVLPSFISGFFISREEISDLAPYNQARKLAYDTSSPVGGMSVFASLIYLFGSPWIGIFFMDLIFFLLVKLSYNPILKSALIFSFVINALNFWRDPLGISLKNIVQTFIVLISLYVFIKIRSNLRKVQPNTRSSLLRLGALNVTLSTASDKSS